MKLIQVCNVGQILGGTAACAWSITRAFPDLAHHIICLTPPDAMTRHVFAPATVSFAPRIKVSMLQEFKPDCVIFHNTDPSKVEGQISEPMLQCPALYYAHSAGSHLLQIRTVFCSQWLAQRVTKKCDDEAVLYQPVPRAIPLLYDSAYAYQPLTIGRICTPQAKKWPLLALKCYQRWAADFPLIQWEFVGCPTGMQSNLQQYCQGRARFYSASWEARRRVTTWDALLYHHPTITESFGRTCAEAMRVGCVPIVDQRGGFMEQCPEGTGFLCATHEDFTAAIERLHDSVVRQQRKQACQRHADSLFAFRSFRERFLKLWT
jgi:hypothetical protein